MFKTHNVDIMCMTCGEICIYGTLAGSVVTDVKFYKGTSDGELRAHMVHGRNIPYQWYQKIEITHYGDRNHRAYYK